MTMRFLRFLFMATCLCVVPQLLPAQVTVRNGMSYVGAYSSLSTYAKGDTASSSGIYYVSLVGGNIGNTPASSPTQWGALGSSASAITALTADVTATGPGSAAATLATVNSSSGACGDATHVCQVTTNAKGLTTAQTAVPITGSTGVPSVNSIAGAVTIAAGPGATVSTAGSTITIGASGGGGTSYETRILKTVAQEYQTCAAGAICQLMSVSGPGTLSSIDLSVNSSSCSGSLLDIVVDGNLILSAPVGLVFGVYGQGPCGGGAAQVFSSPKESLNQLVGSDWGGLIHWSIPFASSLAVYLQQDPAGGTTGYFFNGDYYAGGAPSGLYPAQWAYFNSYYANQSVAQYANLTWLPTFSGVGALESVQTYTSGAADLSFLEGDSTITADGNSYTYGGTEDFFCGSNYFANSKGNISGSCGSSFVGTTNAGMFRFFDLWPSGTDNRPVIFNSSLGLTGPNGQSGQGSPGAVASQSLVTWYSESAAITPTYTGKNCSNNISATSTSETCTLQVFKSGDTIAGYIGATSLSSATATCGTVSTARTVSWAGGAVEMIVFYIPNSTSGSCTITFNYPSQGNVNSQAVDIANANTSSPIDNTNCTSTPFCSSTGTGSVIGTAGSITTAGTNELVLGFTIYGGGTTISGVGWNSVPQSYSGTGETSAYLPAFSTGSYTPAFLNASGTGGANWVTSTIAIKH
jgi:hypothetical protein